MVLNGVKFSLAVIVEIAPVNGRLTVVTPVLAKVAVPVRVVRKPLDDNLKYTTVLTAPPLGFNITVVPNVELSVLTAKLVGAVTVI